MKYDIVRGMSSFELVETVNAKLEQGWKLYGNPILYEQYGYFYQAMTLDEPATPMPRVASNSDGVSWVSAGYEGKVM